MRGDNDKNFYWSREQRKTYWDQGKTSLKRFTEQVVLLMAIKERLRIRGDMYHPRFPAGKGLKVHSEMHSGICILNLSGRPIWARF